MYLFHSSKGGNGTTLVTVACALAEVAQRPRAVLVDLCGDVPAVLGMAEPVGPGVNDWLAENSTADVDTLLHCGTTVENGLLVIHRGAEHVEGSPRWALLAATLATLPAPAKCPLRSASTSAVSSTNSPRPTFMKNEPGFMQARALVSMRLRVSSFNGSASAT